MDWTITYRVIDKHWGEWLAISSDPAELPIRCQVVAEDATKLPSYKEAGRLMVIDDILKAEGFSPMGSNPEREQRRAELWQLSGRQPSWAVAGGG